MTQKEKAEELIGKFINFTGETHPYSNAKQCALICVDEIINNGQHGAIEKLYWRDVREELNLL